MNIDDLLATINSAAEAFVAEMVEAKPSMLGLDERASFDPVFVGDDAIAITLNQRQKFEYYGAMEYVDDEYVFEAGDWVFYRAGDPRVDAALESFAEYCQEA